MAYVLRLIAGAALCLFGSVAFANSCVSGNWYAVLYSSNLLCHDGCVFSWNSVDKVYVSTGEHCSNGSEGSGSGSGDGGSGGGDSGSDSGSGGSGNGNGNGNGNGSDSDTGSGDDDESGSGKNPGIPDNAVFCDSDAIYKHKCYDDDGDYWYKNIYRDVCDSEEEQNRWNDCYYDGEYYSSSYLGGGQWKSEKWKDFDEYRYEQCRDDYGVHGSYSTEDAVKHWYCIQRYRPTYESELYDNANADFNNDKTAADIVDNEEIDIRKKFGISENGEGSLSSSIPDLLKNYVPEKSGAHGVCLDDLKIEIGETEITLEISRVCEWLEILGKILVFISLFVAIRIVTRD